MDDLSGLSWDSASSNSNSTNKARAPSTYPSLQFPSNPIPRGPSPLSGRSTPSATPLPAAAVSKPTGQDSFAALLGSYGSKKPNALSLQQQQAQLLEQKAKLAAAQHQDQFRTNDTAFWEGLGSGRSTPAQPPPQLKSQPSEDVDDLLAAFDASAPVDSSSFYPPAPSSRSSNERTSRSQSTRGRQISSQRPRIHAQVDQGNSLLAHEEGDDDDDPFGLGMRSSKPTLPQMTTPSNYDNDDDDILGMLGRPVVESRRQPNPPPPPSQDRQSSRSRGRRPDPSAADFESHDQTPSSGHPQAKAVAELVDMGFPEDKARQALEQTETGLDTQAAVGWLLTRAHEEAKSRTKAQQMTATDRPGSVPGRRRQEERPHNGVDDDDDGNGDPVWSRQPSRQAQPDRHSPAFADGDVAQYASQIGSSLFKSANSLWKTGQKKAQKALADYQQRDSSQDSSQPKWMRDAELRNGNSKFAESQDATSEAMMLDMARAPESRRSATRNASPRDPVLPERPRQVPFEDTRSRELPSRPSSRPVEKLSRQAIEQESAQAYVSPARRKKAAQAQAQVQAPEPATAKVPAQEEASLDIFSDIQAPVPTKPSTPASSSSVRAVSKPSNPTPVRPSAKARPVPSVSPTALSTSTRQRQLGSEAFKRGDYGEATSCYSAALSPLPPSHPIVIILHCNRSLTLLKTGDAKGSLADAEAALKLIGPARGEGESISVAAGESDKPMREFYGKAIMRKAEALEHLEKWDQGAIAWHEAVEAGIGGAVSIAGRNRCEKAGGNGSSKPAAPIASSRPPPKKAPTSRPTPRQPISNLSSLAAQPSSEAVTRLRAANAAAAKASDEAFALTDQVTARVDGWKGGKEGNLRALLASLDTVLWSGAGWKKVGMGDVVLPNKVKIVYMKAIAKVHPDKLAQDATTEQRMVSASVFATLNEAWDKFKKDNNM